MADGPLFERGFNLLECVACGLCLEVCPTYNLRRDESANPRGRIRLMHLLERKQAGDTAFAADFQVWRTGLDDCIGCLACQSRCPAGVPYGAMLDRAHERLAQESPACAGGRLAEFALEHLVPKPDRLRRLRLPLKLFVASRLPSLILKLRLDRLPGLGFLAGLRWLPRRIESGRAVPQRSSGAPYLFFRGCVGGLLYSGEESAAMALLGATGGYDLADNTCCGAVHRHLGRLERACELARRNIAAFENKEGLIVTQAAGCGAALKEYGEWLGEDPEWRERAERFSARVRDLSEVLNPEDFVGGCVDSASRRVTYDDPCHALHAQGIGERPRALIDVLPGIERVEMRHCDKCCGSGGSYFLRRPEMSRALIAEKMTFFEQTGVDMLLTSNPGCRLQWETALREAGEEVEVRHPAELWVEGLKSRKDDGNRQAHRE
ncbi:MAG: (Fe-S)-binding protein [bacterium]|nr:(Fe-S)-binding protein [bacterium]